METSPSENTMSNLVNSSALHNNSCKFCTRGSFKISWTMPLTPLLTHFAFSINDLECTGMYWNVLEIKPLTVLENVLEYTGISLIILCGHPVSEYLILIVCLHFEV